MIRHLCALLAIASAVVSSAARAEQLGSFSYGTARGCVGLNDAPGAERQGPRSFAVDARGSVYICDTVNARVVVVPRGGGAPAHYPVEGVVADIAPDGEGGFLVIDEAAAAIRRYDASGAPRGGVRVPRALMEQKDLLAVTGGRVCLRSREGKERSVAALEGTTIVDAAPAAQRDGETACLSYDVRKETGEGAAVTVRDGGGTIVRRFGFAVPRLASVAFLGADARGNICVQVERHRPGGGGVSLGVVRLGPDGKILSRLNDLPNDYACWTARLLCTDANGDICQLLPARDRVYVNRWRWNAFAGRDRTGGAVP